ncbi:single-stranded DNA-binding protein [Nocardioides sp. GXZ039]|uniref:single-stranded DNA-binding protein n=1 Tax=Nocardioides sp. GXZ039 TaxID=3136018 RepID=UPI0030F46346
MATKTKTEPAPVEAAVNEVRLVGRLAAPAEIRELPSGDVLLSFRVVVDRPAGPQRRQPVDALECVAWNGRVRRSVQSWRRGDLVELSGAVRRRFFRTAAGPASRVEIEVSGARLLRRSTSG